MRALGRHRLGLPLLGLAGLAAFGGLIGPGVGAAPAFASAQVIIVNVNNPGEGFNDPSPRAPVGGNTGTTLGQQRLIVFQSAAAIWGALLDSAVPIYVQSEFIPLFCAPTTGQLGAAGPLEMFANFPRAPRPNTWYVGALANRLSFSDLDPGAHNTNADDIQAVFNSAIGTDPNCLTGRDWYYGLDNNHGPNLDLVTVLLHEFSHGLGFGPFFDPATGALIAPNHDIFEHFLVDTTSGLHFDQMTDAQRVASSVNSRRVVWDGANVTSQVPTRLAAGTPLLNFSTPAALGYFSVGTAAFGPALTSPGISANIVAALDDANTAGPTTLDGCTALTNSAAVAGNIALIDRGGSCDFPTKVKIAQDAGALAVLIADNVVSTPPGALAGSGPTVTIPSVRISQADGQTLRAALASGTVTATLGINLAVHLGADPSGRAMLAAPNPLRPGTSLFHWDASAFPNLLMEPSINLDLTHSVDLTLPLFRDIGWFPDADLDGVVDAEDQCAASILTPTVVIGQCDSKVPNSLFTTGCTISDLVGNCQPAATRAHDNNFHDCVKALAKDLKKNGTITNKQSKSLEDCSENEGHEN